MHLAGQGTWNGGSKGQARTSQGGVYILAPCWARAVQSKEGGDGVCRILEGVHMILEGVCRILEGVWRITEGVLSGIPDIGGGT